MAIVKVAKLLDDTSDFSNIPDNTWLLSKEDGLNKGIKLGYRSGGSNLRVLSPLEEFEKYYSFDNVSDDELATPTSIDIEAGYSSIVIVNTTVRPDDLVITLPQVDASNFSKNIYYTYNVRFAVDTNKQGFTIRKNPDSAGLIFGSKHSIVIKKSYTTFEFYLGPDNKWRINGIYENLSDASEVLLLTS